MSIQIRQSTPGINRPGIKHPGIKHPGIRHHSPLLMCGIHALLLFAVSGCQPAFQRIDREVESLMALMNRDMGGDSKTPLFKAWDLDASEKQPRPVSNPIAEKLPTFNPSAEDLEFLPSAASDTEQVIARLEGYNVEYEDAIQLDLEAALAYAMQHSRDFRFAEEEFVLAALRLLIERHQWGPRFFNDFSATVQGDATKGLFDTSLRLVNEFRVTQRLPYGGTVSARALARATEDLHQFTTEENTQSADIILQADIPLLRGAGTVARESRIQTERNMIYESRDFERFRREYLVRIASQFLNLVVQQKSLANSERSVTSLELLEARELALHDGGRITRFAAALSENATVRQRDDLNRSRETYRLSVDRFKVQIGMPVDQPMVIVDSSFGLPTPDIGLNEAVQIAMSNRLDLQTRRDQLADAYRAVQNARNDLLPDLNFDASATLPTDPDQDQAGLDFDPDELSFQAGVTFGLPLDREIERLNVRQAQIRLERARRSYEEFRDNVAIDVRAAVRGIDAALFSLQIQERGIEIAQQRKASIDAAPDRANSRDNADAIDDLLQSQDQRDRARRNLEVSILEYLRDTGQLRINPEGSILPLKGMKFSQKSDGQEPETPEENAATLPPMAEEGVSDE